MTTQEYIEKGLKVVALERETQDLNTMLHQTRAVTCLKEERLAIQALIDLKTTAKMNIIYEIREHTKKKGWDQTKEGTRQTWSFL